MAVILPETTERDDLEDLFGKEIPCMSEHCEEPAAWRVWCKVHCPCIAAFGPEWVIICLLCNVCKLKGEVMGLDCVWHGPKVGEVLRAEPL